MLRCVQLICLMPINARHFIYESLQPVLVERNSCQNNTNAKRLAYISPSTDCNNTNHTRTERRLKNCKVY